MKMRFCKKLKIFSSNLRDCRFVFDFIRLELVSREKRSDMEIRSDSDRSMGSGLYFISDWKIFV